jgi:hypothetical protein
MPNPTSPAQGADPAQILVSVAELLHRTASAAWARAELEGPFGAMYSLAHAIHLAAALAANLVPEGADVPSTEFDVSPGDTAAALTRAEQLARLVPVEDLPTGSSRLIAMLADLTRQVQP